MDLADVMDEIGDQLDTITGLRVHRYPAPSVQPPAAVVSYPDELTYDSTYARGMDEMTLPVVVLVGKASERSARNRLGAYLNGSGARSIKAVIEAGTYTAFDSARVTGAEIDVVQVAGTDLLAATFSIDIAGTGA